MLSLIASAYLVPSAFFSYQLYKDRKYSKQYIDANLKVYDPIEKRLLRIIVLSKKKYAVSLVPLIRIATYSDKLSKDILTINSLVRVYNMKIKCEHCSIVAAHHTYELTPDLLGKCSFCEEATEYLVIQGEDDNYPFFVPKTKQEIIDMLDKRSKEMPLILKNQIIDDQYEKLKQLNEKKNKVTLVEDSPKSIIFNKTILGLHQDNLNSLNDVRKDLDLNEERNDSSRNSLD